MLDFVKNILEREKKEEKNKDVGFIHDYMFFLQNLIALEHHLIESFSISKDITQRDLAQRVRGIRSKWMYLKTPESKNQIYCESKHLMACAISLKEMGNRFLTEGNKKLSEECYIDSSDMEAIFILLNEEKGGNNV